MNNLQNFDKSTDMEYWNYWNEWPKPNFDIDDLLSQIHLNSYMSLDNKVRIALRVCIKNAAYFSIIRISTMQSTKFALEFHN